MVIDKPEQALRIIVYRSRGNWRWRMQCARNGKIVGASSEGYRRRAAAMHNLETVTGLNVSFWMDRKIAAVKLSAAADRDYTIDRATPFSPSLLDANG